MFNNKSKRPKIVNTHIYRESVPYTVCTEWGPSKPNFLKSTARDNNPPMLLELNENTKFLTPDLSE